MGHLLQAGDSVLGYDLSRAIIDDEILEKLAFQQDAILVKKIYPDKLKVPSKKQKRRNRRGKAKQEKPTTTIEEVDEVDDLIIPSAPLDGEDANLEISADHLSLEAMQSKKIVKTSVFGWTGGDDEEYQEFHRKLALEDHDEDEVEVEEDRETLVPALDDDIDDDTGVSHEQSDNIASF